MPRDIPIIFSAPMVRALIDGHKTQTRRLAWLPRREIRKASRVFGCPPSPWQKIEPGDRLWARENFRPWKGSATGKTIVYAADDRWLDHGSGETFIDKVQWLTPVRPSIHMPRWASRLTLIVEDTKIEPLQAISEEDARAEGVQHMAFEAKNCHEYFIPIGGGQLLTGWTAREVFAGLWQTLHGAGSWHGNPEVVAPTFRVVRANIDAPEAQAA